MLTAEEKAKVFKWLGYPQVKVAMLSSLQSVQSSWALGQVLDQLKEEAEVIVRDILSKLDTLETRLMEAADILEVKNVGSIAMRDDPGAAIRKEMRYWVRKLSEIVDIPIRPGSTFAGGGINAEVRP